MSPESTPRLDALRARGEISALDHAFARSLARLSGDARPDVLLAAALASRQMTRGDVCLDLPALARAQAPEAAAGPDPGSDGGDAIPWPPLADWLAALAESPLVARDAAEADRRPLVLDANGRLYLQRFFRHQTRVAEALLARCVEAPLGDPDTLRASIESFVPRRPESDEDGSRGESDGPRQAVAVAAGRRLCVVSGGPGTGKTTTAARLLAVQVDCALRAGRPAPRIALAAPTGKAAARLAEAIATVLATLPASDAVRQAIPLSATTLHRLLRIDARRLRRRAAPLRLGFDLVLVDEASMIDLALMARLLDAMADETRLVLLGDADQLASVEAGSVFSDLCGGPEARAAETDAVPAIRSCVVTLRTSHRYAAESGIRALADAVREGDAERALAVLADERLPDVSLAPPVGRGRLGEPMEQAAVAGYGPFARADGATARLAALEGFRVLCALREGPFGVLRMNRAIDDLLVAAGLLESRLHGPGAEAGGRPVLVTRNAPETGLWNGDVGVLLRTPSSEGGGLRAVFRRSDGTLRDLGLSRLPPHEPVFAMSVHKSQGSELDEVALVLPDEPVPLVTRELVYTAVTRARRRVVVHASLPVLRAALASRIARASGLRDALWSST